MCGVGWSERTGSDTRVFNETYPNRWFGDVLSDARYREAARRAGHSVAGLSDPVEVCHRATR